MSFQARKNNLSSDRPPTGKEPNSRSLDQLFQLGPASEPIGTDVDDDDRVLALLEPLRDLGDAMFQHVRLGRLVSQLVANRRRMRSRKLGLPQRRVRDLGMDQIGGKGQVYGSALGQSASDDTVDLGRPVGVLFEDTDGATDMRGHLGKRVESARTA
jgi:hypothetical protein